MIGGVTIIKKKEAMNVKKSEERDIGETWREGNGKMMQLYYYLKNQIIFKKTFDLKE